MSREFRNRNHYKFSVRGKIVKVTVACDICRHRYQANEQRLGTKRKCQYCESVFKLKEAPETDEADNDPDSVSPFWQVMQRLGHGGTGVVVLAVLVFMVSLIFTDPRTSTASTRRKHSSSGRNSSFASNPFARTPGKNPHTKPNTSVPTSNQAHAQRMREIQRKMAIPKLDMHVPTAKDFNLQPIPAPSMRFSDSPEIGTDPKHLNLPSVSPPPSSPVPNQKTFSQGSGFQNQPSKKTTVASQSTGSTLNYDGPGSIVPSGRTVQMASQLKKGQVVLVRWNTSWFPADVLKVASNSVRIHYRGWAESWDEDVPIDRIQFAHKEFEDRSR
ncbi:hypothetical protein [Thalassoglobus sp.]|uniref:hypothetical protein n=1 Tax=Thalassoglobus sp. TaxID=2795869 RepID=UPI003AA9B9FF